METLVLGRLAWPASSQRNKTETLRSSWEVGTPWDKPGCGHRIEKPGAQDCREQMCGSLAVHLTRASFIHATKYMLFTQDCAGHSLGRA